MYSEALQRWVRHPRRFCGNLFHAVSFKIHHNRIQRLDVVEISKCIAFVAISMRCAARLRRSGVTHKICISLAIRTKSGCVLKINSNAPSFALANRIIISFDSHVIARDASALQITGRSRSFHWCECVTNGYSMATCNCDAVQHSLNYFSTKHIINS